MIFIGIKKLEINKTKIKFLSAIKYKDLLVVNLLMFLYCPLKKYNEKAKVTDNNILVIT